MVFNVVMIIVCLVMVQVMMVESRAMLLESSRVCGNLSRLPEVRDILVRNQGRVDPADLNSKPSKGCNYIYPTCHMEVYVGILI